MSPRKQEITEEERQPNVELRVSHLERWFRPYLGHLVLAAVFGGTTYYSHNSAAADRDVAQRITTRRMQELMDPIDKRLAHLEAHEDQVNQMRADLAAIRQAVEDLRGIHLERSTFTSPGRDFPPGTVAAVKAAE